MIVHTPRQLKALRLLLRALGLIALAPSLLLAVRAPTYQLWMLRVGLIEWGHQLAVALLVLPCSPTLRRMWGRFIWPLSAVAGVVMLSPLAGAFPLARRLPRDLEQAFGPGQGGPTRAPLALADLVRAVVHTRTVPQRLPYACVNDLELSLDFYPALQPSAGSGLAPLVVVIHGGAWEGGDSTQLPDLNHFLAAQGYAVAALNHRLAPHYPYPAAYDDVRAALDCLKQHASELGVDAGRIVLLGRSSGGHLALLAGYRAVDPAIRGVVALYPPTDLRGCYEFPRGPHVLDGWGVLERFLGGTPAEVPQRYHEASPINYVGPSTPPTLLVHGVLDEIVGVDNSAWLAQRLRAAGRPHYFLRLPWATHGCDANLSGPSGQLCIYAIERFLDAVMAA
jgi:acetyl esterase/lipase